jgi:anti-sigma-K factor RskA
VGTYNETVQPTGPCPSDADKIAESYVMGTLSAADAATFEEHYVACADCAAMLQRVAAYVEAMPAAARRLRADAPRITALGAGHGSS